MPKSKAQKQETVKELKEDFRQARAVVLADIQGLKARDVVVLRRRVKEGKGKLKIAKKTLLNLAFQNEKLDPRRVAGEIAVLFALEDPVLPLKSLYDFSKEHENLKLVGGFFDQLVLGKDEILRLAQLPSRQELLTQLVASLASPLRGMVSVMQGNIKGLITVLAKAKT